MFNFFRRKKQENPTPEEAVQNERPDSAAEAVPEQSVEEMLASLENVFAKEAAQKAQAEPPFAEGLDKSVENQQSEPEISVKETTAQSVNESAEAAERPSENIQADTAAAEDGQPQTVSEETQETAAAADNAAEEQEPSEPEIEVLPAEEKSAEAGLSGFEIRHESITFQQFIVTEGAQEMPSENVREVAEAEQKAEPEAEPEQPKLSWAVRLKQGLAKSRDKMAKSLAGVFGGGQIDEDLYEELETVLITGDMGMEATRYLMKDVRNRVSLKGLKDGGELRGALKDALYDLIKPLEQPLVLPESKEPFVIMLAGINGAGKTTSIGKLAKYFQSQGKSVLLAAGDTFRAAAREQLQAWGERNNVTVISQATGDSAAVCFDAVQAAKARGIDIVLADTAGRLPTQLHLMEEIKKVKRVLQKAMPDAPHEIIVVLDANIGQNAVNQVKAFDDALGLTGLIVTKLDGTAKGGILAALASERPIPVRYIGVGEGIDDLRPFDARAFIDALLD